MRLAEEAKRRELITIELIPDRVVPADLPLLRGRVGGITIPALRNGSRDPSYPSGFQVTPQQRSIASAVIVGRTGIESVPSLTCRDFRSSDLSTIPTLLEQGLENFLVVFGDPFPDSNVKKYHFHRSQDLIREIGRVCDGKGPCVGAVTNQYAADSEREISRTLAKVDAGASFVLTNVAFDDEAVLEHVDDLQSHGLNAPLFIQVSIPASLDNLLFVTHKFGIPIPEHVREKLVKNPGGGGLSIAAGAFEVLRHEANGIHFSYLLRSRNPIPAYCRLLDMIGAQRSPVTVQVEAAVGRHAAP